MPNHFTNIGFRVESERDFTELATSVAPHGVVQEAESGLFVMFEDESGIVLVVLADHEHQLIGVNPHFRGSSTYKVRVSECVCDGITQMEGSVKAWACPQQAVGTPGLFPFRFEVPDFGLVQASLESQPEVIVQLTGFAHYVKCYADEDAYANDQPPGPKRATKSFLPSGMIKMEDEEDQQETAEAIVTGVIRAAKMKINPFTGHGFWHLAVSTVGGDVDVVADPEIVEGLPVNGGVFTGLVWLSGRLLMHVRD